MTMLGTPYERGKSDVIVSRLVDAPIEEGLIVADTGDKKVELFADGKLPFGVMGQNEIVGASVVVAGLRVWAQADDDCVPAMGAQVFITPEGKVASAEDGNVGVNATFANEEVRDNGEVTNTAEKSKTKKCVCINFVGGF